MRYFLTLIVLCMCVSSCQVSEGTEPTGDMKGIYIRGHEAFESVFVPCSTKEIWWTEGTEEFNRLVDLYESLIKEPYGKLYVRARGNYSKSQGNSDYAGKFVLTKLLDQSTDARMISECERLTGKPGSNQ